MRKMKSFKFNYFYYVVVNKENGKYSAHAERVHGSNCIKRYFKADNIETVMPAATFKEAKEIAECWNECYKSNGTYMF